MSNSPHTLKNSYIVPAFFERLVDFSYDYRNFKERYTCTFYPGEVTTYQTCTIDDKRYGKTK